MLVVPLVGVFENDKRVIASGFDEIFSKEDLSLEFYSSQENVVKIKEPVTLEQIKGLLLQIEEVRAWSDFDGVKKFFANYKRIYGDWPKALADNEGKSADELAVEWSVRREANQDEVLLEKLNEHLLRSCRRLEEGSAVS